MDTQVNESLNFSIIITAPKNKVFCGTRSLANRLGIAIGIACIGFQAHFELLFDRLGIQVTPNVHHCLGVTEKQRNKRLSDRKKHEEKKKRNKRKHQNLKRDTAIAKAERFKCNNPQYKCGGHMQEGGSDADGEPKKKKVRTPAICSHPLCQLKGQKTTKSRKCKMHLNNRAITLAAAGLPLDWQIDQVPAPVGTG